MGLIVMQNLLLAVPKMDNQDVAMGISITSIWGEFITLAEIPNGGVLIGKNAILG